MAFPKIRSESWNTISVLPVAVVENTFVTSNDSLKLIKPFTIPKLRSSGAVTFGEAMHIDFSSVNDTSHQYLLEDSIMRIPAAAGTLSNSS